MNITVIMDKLNGMSRGEILALMEAEKVTGIQEAAAHCVIAQYIKQYVEGDLGIFGVCPSTVMVGDQTYETSPELAAFIREFDQGYYPELSVGMLSALERKEIDGEIMKALEEVG